MPLQLKNYDPAIMQGASIDVNLDLAEILDPAGNEMLEFDQVASAVNFLRLLNAAAGSPVDLQSQGDDTNIGLTLTPKGTGSVVLATSGVTTTIALDINASGITTGNVIDIGDADVVTTGTLVNVYSNSSSTSTRALVRIVNDNSAASGATPLLIQQDGTLAAIRLIGAPVKGIDLTALSGTGAALIVTETTNAPSSVATSGYLQVKLSSGTDRYIKLFTM